MSSISGISPAVPPFSYQAPSSVQPQDPDGDGDIGSENTIGDQDGAKAASQLQAAGSAGGDGDQDGDKASASSAVGGKVDITA